MFFGKAAGHRVLAVKVEHGNSRPGRRQHESGCSLWVRLEFQERMFNESPAGGQASTVVLATGDWQLITNH